MDASSTPSATPGKEPEKYIRTFAGDMDMVKKGGTPDFAPLGAVSPPKPTAPPIAPKPVQPPVPAYTATTVSYCTLSPAPPQVAPKIRRSKPTQMIFLSG